MYLLAHFFFTCAGRYLVWVVAGLFVTCYVLFCGAAYCVVAVESAGRQIPIAFLERVKDEFTKKYGGGKAATAAAKGLNKEFG